MTSRLKPLSARAVESLRTAAFVGGAPGLELRVHSEGVRSWRLFYRLPGSDRRYAMKLGRYPDLSLADARSLAREKLALASEGRDPKRVREEIAETQARTVGQAVSGYLAMCAADNDPKTVTDKRGVLERLLVADMGDLAISDVRRSDIVRLLDGLANRPGLRRVAYAYIHHFLNWCSDRELIAANPMLGLKPPKSVPARDRMLTDAELAALWNAEGVYATIARLCLPTAQRRGSIEAMRWDEIGLERRVWTVPAAEMKSGKLHEVPLSLAAVDEIARLARLTGPYVFGVGSDGQKPYAGGSNGMEGLRRQVGGADWRLHDLRRTAVTLAQRGGASIEEIRALTQHKTPGVIGVYARHAYTNEKRKVVNIIADQVTALLEARR